MFKSRNWLWICLILFYGSFSILIWAEAPGSSPIEEITVIGVAPIGSDQDSSYRNAIFDAFRKAFVKIRPTQNSSSDAFSSDNIQKNDLIQAQKELGITKYQVLRYWRSDNNFNIEIKVFFGEAKVDQPRPIKSQLPRIKWIHQTTDEITALKGSLNITIATPQTIEVISIDNGKRMQWVKTGLNPHKINNDYFLVQDGANLKLCSFKKFNLFNLLDYKVIYQWRKTLPEMIRLYLSDSSAYTVERSGLVRAFDLETDGEKWNLPMNSQVELEQVNPKYVLAMLPQGEIWMIDENGNKIWIKKFETKLAAKPVEIDGELICVFDNGEVKVFNIDSGGVISSWNLTFDKEPQDLNIAVKEDRLFLLYNDLANQGHMQVYQRFTGSLLWKVNWEGAMATSVAIFPEEVVMGIKNNIEARDLFLGIKLWEEPLNGKIDHVYGRNDNKLLVVSGNRLYEYDLK